MKQKLVQKEKAEEHPAQYDENGKMMLPVLENGKMEMKTQDQLKELLDKKDQKAKVKKTPLPNNKQSKVVKERKIADASYRIKFVDLVITKIPEITKVEKDDRVILKFGTNALCRLMVRVNSRMCVYRKTETGERDTVRIISDEDEKELLKWIQERVEVLKAKAPKPKKTKVKSNSGGAKKVSTIEKLNSAEATAKTHKDANGFSLKSNKIKVTPKVEEWVKEKGYTLNSTSVRF